MTAAAVLIATLIFAALIIVWGGLLPLRRL
jgi:hypothetical protein